MKYYQEVTVNEEEEDEQQQQQVDDVHVKFSHRRVLIVLLCVSLSLSLFF